MRVDLSSYRYNTILSCMNNSAVLNLDLDKYKEIKNNKFYKTMKKNTEIYNEQGKIKDFNVTGMLLDNKV